MNGFVVSVTKRPQYGRSYFDLIGSRIKIVFGIANFFAFLINHNGFGVARLREH